MERKTAAKETARAIVMLRLIVGLTAREKYPVLSTCAVPTIDIAEYVPSSYHTQPLYYIVSEAITCSETDSCDFPHPDAPCQQVFSFCSTISGPSCGGSSALGRSIACYQVGNNYGRKCQRISPSRIDTTGLSDLNLAFASIDPTTSGFVTTDSRDVPYYTEFTAL
ncbi:hypothetical protein GGR54DRAFT_429474 [Hypoxylon sp. NC1633]|nr:hypothetical protein GGR54DRAFT_429474 [Hypoxylon sp. NC1633]